MELSLGLIYVPKLHELSLLWPVLAMIGTVAAVLIGSLVVPRPASRRILPGLAVLGMLIAIGAVFKFHLFERAGSPTQFLAGSLVFDNVSLFIALLISVFLIGVIVLSTLLWRDRPIEWPVFLSLLVGSGVGMVLLASTTNLLMFVIAVELASLSSYVLVGFRRGNRKAAEGSTKYAIFGAVCSGLMLYGVSLLFGSSGSFDFVRISTHLGDGSGRVISMIGLGCLFVGLGFKLSLVPMHFWCPDAFEAAGADVAAWLSVASKSAALIALARFSQLVVVNAPELQPYVYWTLAVTAIVTMTLANLSAYWQSSVKRLLAYSSIAHAGYMVCGVALLSQAGVGAILAYVMVYMLMNLGAFAVTGFVERATGSDDMGQFRQLGTRNPAMAAMMMIFLFSLVGLPPLAGFAVKWILLAELWKGGSVVLVAFILANTVISLFYYMRLARAMYFERTPQAESSLMIPAGSSALLGVCTVGLLVIFIGWGILSEIGKRLASGMFG
jgi:NADH-quinone oxidoreductase subunit N